MKKYFIGMLAAVLILSTFFMASSATAKETKIMEFNSMVGVPSALTGTKAPIRGINGGGIPWMIGSASGELLADGHLDIEVQGLVLAAGALNGSNPIANFRATVSCLTSTGSVMNTTTDLFPATTGAASLGGGNAEIEADLSLPQPCIAPIIFVTSPGGSWFAATGN